MKIRLRSLPYLTTEDWGIKFASEILKTKKKKKKIEQFYNTMEGAAFYSYILRKII